MSAGKEFDVICIGQIVQDILVTDIPQDALTSGKDTYLAGMVKTSLGGDAANEAAALAKMGDHAAFLGRLGTDAIGEALLHAMEAMHIDTSLAIRLDESKNFSTVVVIKQDKTHTFFVGPGEKDLAVKDDIDFSIFGKTRAVCAGSLFALGDLDLNGIADIFEAARSNGALTFADMTFDFKGIGPRALDYLYKHVDYLVPSFTEAAFVTGEEEPEKMADAFLKMGAKNVVIKLGGDGCYFRNAEKSFYTDPFDIEPLNTTGCGDNFTGGFIHSILQGKTPEESCEFACGIGALNATGVGASLVVQSEQHVLDFMKETKKRHIDR